MRKGSQMKIRSLFMAASAAALISGGHLAQAAPGAFYQTTFQGATFLITEFDSDTLIFNISGTVPLEPDWATAASFAAFDLRDLGLNFKNGGATGTANGPGATNLVGTNAQANASGPGCATQGTPAGSICFDIVNQALTAPFSFEYTIDFNQNFNILDTGPHLKVQFLNSDGEKVGSLYSRNIPLTSSSTSSTASASSSSVPEPASSTLALLGVGLLAGALRQRRKVRSA